MGKLLIYFRYVFFVFSSDVHETRRHVHIKERGNKNKLCKFWLEPEIELEYNYGFHRKEIIAIEKLVKEYFNDIISQLFIFYSGKRVKLIIKK
ncbi:MAG: DUF4160 domain-containing protein [Bacteroidetes bacterium]|nr:DUF4160 domain-containing protein [Bacteroidota bacterium]